ncbi:hypothetical protein BurJ1DRAFT_2723 [Burkholderiales bacterium JOSHI_001]|nr:hypothetical protein BurJ1DRAFT_2723 [Burkholderiales bacterium JOSHI_001]
MLITLRRWLSRGPGSGDASSIIANWAHARHFTHRRMREPVGAVVECALGRQAWRLEWGPSQRDYIPGHELRLVAELDVPRDLFALVLNRSLMEVLEKSVFDEFVQGVQTRIDTETPQEVRWLVMLPRLSGAELRELRERYMALGSAKPWLQTWLAGPLGAALINLATLCSPQRPVVWTLGKGRLTLRTTADHLDAAALDQWHAAFETAMREALRASAELRDSRGGSGQSTMPAAWPRSTLDLEDDAPQR